MTNTSRPCAERDHVKRNMELLHSLSVDVDGVSEGNKRRRTGGVGFEAATSGVEVITPRKLATFAHSQSIEGVIVTKRTGSLSSLNRGLGSRRTSCAVVRFAPNKEASPRTMSANQRTEPLSESNPG